ncbi:MAG: hypothetical protein AAB874_03130 [Patescibacteria group bacterium]
MLLVSRPAAPAPETVPTAPAEVAALATFTVEQQVAATVAAMAPATSSEAPSVAAVATDVPSIRAENTAEVADTAEPIVVASSTPDTLPEATTFTYEPGGEGYAIEVEQLGEGWHRIRTATNGEHPAWTFLVRVNCDAQDVLQWHMATELSVKGPTNCTVEIKRDLQSDSIEPNPYETANSKNSPLGLGWFVKGNGAHVTVDDSSRALDGIGVFQMSFPKDWDGTWTIKISVEDKGLVYLSQGERLTENDTWPLP